MANSRSYGSRSFSVLMFCGSGNAWPAAGTLTAGALTAVTAAPSMLPAFSAALAVLFWSCAISISGITSASITLSADLLRS